MLPSSNTIIFLLSTIRKPPTAKRNVCLHTQQIVQVGRELVGGRWGIRRRMSIWSIKILATACSSI